MMEYQANSRMIREKTERLKALRLAKLLAALRGGIKTVLIPEENAKDLVEIADSIKSGLEIIPVSRMDEVLDRAMTRKPEPIEWDPTTTAATVPKEAPVEDEVSTLTAH
jgi:ATP-dependent Lon protease